MSITKMVLLGNPIIGKTTLIMCIVVYGKTYNLKAFTSSHWLNMHMVNVVCLRD